MPITPKPVIQRLQLAEFLSDHGNKPSDGNDHSAAVVAAITEANAVARSGFQPLIEVPHGNINVAEIDWTDNVPIEGVEAGLSRFVYSGSGGAGTYLFKIPAGSGSVPYTGFRRVSFRGWAGGASDPIAEHLIYNDGRGYDWGFRLDDVHFANCLGNAFDGLDTDIHIVNLHMDRLRFDAIGGYCLALYAGSGAENRPVSVSRSTWDNNANSTFLARVASAYPSYYVDSSTWGKGFCYVSVATGLDLHFSDTRLECNKRLKDVGGFRSFFHDATPSGAAGTWTFVNMVGFADSRDGTALLRADGTQVAYTFLGRNGMGRTRPFEYSGDPDGVASLPNATVQGVSAQVANANSATSTQLRLNGMLADVRESAPGVSTFTNYRKGDRWLRRQPTPGTNGVGQVCIAPDGYGMATASNLTAVAVVTSGSAVVNLSADPTNFYRGVPGASVTLVGAGTAGADLNANILSRDATAQTWTLDTTVSTSVNPCTIKWQVPVWREFGDIAGYGTAAPTSGTYSKGEKVWNTSPSAGGYVGWICITAGSPGTWKGFGLIES